MLTQPLGIPPRSGSAHRQPLPSNGHGRQPAAGVKDKLRLLEVVLTRLHISRLVSLGNIVLALLLLVAKSRRRLRLPVKVHVQGGLPEVDTRGHLRRSGLGEPTRRVLRGWPGGSDTGHIATVA